MPAELKRKVNYEFVVSLLASQELKKGMRWYAAGMAVAHIIQVR